MTPLIGPNKTDIKAEKKNQERNCLTREEKKEKGKTFKKIKDKEERKGQAQDAKR